MPPDRIMTLIQENAAAIYNYQDIISKQPIHYLCKKNGRYFYEMSLLR